MSDIELKKIALLEWRIATLWNSIEIEKQDFIELLIKLNFLDKRNYDYLQIVDSHIDEFFTGKIKISKHDLALFENFKKDFYHLSTEDKIEYANKFCILKEYIETDEEVIKMMDELYMCKVCRTSIYKIRVKNQQVQNEYIKASKNFTKNLSISQAKNVIREIIAGKRIYQICYERDDKKNIMRNGKNRYPDYAKFYNTINENKELIAEFQRARELNCYKNIDEICHKQYNYLEELLKDKRNRYSKFMSMTITNLFKQCFATQCYEARLISPDKFDPKYILNKSLELDRPEIRDGITFKIEPVVVKDTKSKI